MGNRYIFLLGILLLSTALCGCPNSPGGVWVENQAINVDGTLRYFRFFVPDNYLPGAPVVFLLHGGSRSMDSMTANLAGGPQEWPIIAAESGFLLILPNGVNPENGDTAGNNQHWNDCRGDAPLPETGADDVAFINELIDWADTNYAIDTNRVYATGASNGGMMCYRLGIELGERIAAIAAFIANMPGDSECVTPAVLNPVPAFICNGTADTWIPWAGRNAPHDRGSLVSAQATRDYWIAVNDCGDGPVAIVDYFDSDLTDDSIPSGELYTNETTGNEVCFMTVSGGGHTMPTIAHPLGDGLLNLLQLGPQNHDVEGAREAWAFLQRHSKPE